jgi:hypothetical protein
MPVSKKRKKKGKTVKRGSDRMTGLTLQDLINVVAYQEYKEAGVYDDPETVGLPEIPTVENIDFEDPDAQAVIRAVSEVSKVNEKENEDGR